MKIRKSFVTNSSSSSYIIARKQDVTDDEIVEAVLKMPKNVKKEFKNAFIDNFDWMEQDDLEYLEDCNNGFIEAYESKDADTILAFWVRELFNDLNPHYMSQLDTWLVAVKEGSSEDIDVIRNVLYNGGATINTEIFKIILGE